ncbi:MAG: hypothetical protein KBC78_04145 [Candidatus Pacebacteria bacterium]|nr:hypothetical protein [Candidatus Paceibacterota bacterium]
MGGVFLIIATIVENVWSSDTASREEYYVESENQSGGITAGKIEINNQAVFSIISKKMNEKDVVLTIHANEGILPNRLCSTISTDVQVTYVSASFSGLREGDRQTTICFNNPPKDLILTYDVDKRPAYFNVELK